MSRLDHVWVVVAPRKHSTIGDIVFKVSPRELVLQVRGGLSEEDEIAFFVEMADAEAEGNRRLKAYKAYRAVIDGKEATS